MTPKSAKLKNAQRAQRATNTLRHYKSKLLKERGTLGQQEITDLLTDLRHLAATDTTIVLEEAIDASQHHFEEEQRAAEPIVKREPKRATILTSRLLNP